MVQDLDTGVERQLYDKLSRDGQETWSIFGVYPNFAWTPGFAEAGNYVVGFIVTDDGSPAASDAENVTITVEVSGVSDTVRCSRLDARVVGGLFVVVTQFASSEE